MKFCAAALYAVLTIVLVAGGPTHGQDDPNAETGAVEVSQLLADLVSDPVAKPAALLGIALPASFAGDLTCNDCGNVRYRLNLWPDHVFSLNRRGLASNWSQDSIGRWSTRDQGRTLVLRDAEGELRFQVRSPNHLRLTGRGGVNVAPVQTAELTGKAGVTPSDLRLPLRGMVSFLAESARITECLTGRDYPLAAEGDFDTLEAAYLAAGVAQGKPLMMSFEGAITQAPLSTGQGSETVVVVRRFTGVWPDETCEQDKADVSLEGTRWRIVRLGKTDIAAEGGRMPYLVLKEDEQHFVATVGCNQLMGQFVRQGDGLTFQLAASTMMACPPPLDAWESQLKTALNKAATWQVNGQALEFMDASGMQIALFEVKSAP